MSLSYLWTQLFKWIGMGDSIFLFENRQYSMRVWRGKSPYINRWRDKNWIKIKFGFKLPSVVHIPYVWWNGHWHRRPRFASTLDGFYNNTTQLDIIDQLCLNCIAAQSYECCFCFPTLNTLLVGLVMWPYFLRLFSLPLFICCCWYL